MRYRQLLRTSEFTPLFATVTVGYGAVTMQGIALAVLVYRRTGSPLLTALSMFGPSVAQLLGALTLLSLTDRVRPRPALAASAAAFAAVAAIVATPGLSTPLVLALVGASGLVSVVRNGVQWGLLTEILPAPHYLLGRSLFTMSNGIMQMLGFGLGGLLVAVTSPRTTLLLAASAHALSAAIALVGIGDHRPRAGGERSVRRTWADNLSLFSQSRRRRLFVAMWVPNGLIVGCEALFVPYSPHWSGVLFAASAAGMLFGDVLVARVLSAAGRARSRLPLRLLLAVPYLAFALHPPIAAASALVLVASLGYGATLLLQEELLRSVPRSLTGHALGLHSCGLLAMQAVGATLAGTLAGRLSPALTMTCLAVASIAVTLSVSPGKSQAAQPTTRKEKPEYDRPTHGECGHRGRRPRRRDGVLRRSRPEGAG